MENSSGQAYKSQTAQPVKLKYQIQSCTNQDNTDVFDAVIPVCAGPSWSLLQEISKVRRVAAATISILVFIAFSFKVYTQ